jgi:hypothetical protein
MSFKAVAWMLLAAMALAAILLLNYWASYQPLSTLAYSGIVLAFGGLANLVLPFRFLGIRKRAVGALILVAGVGLALAALLWPAPLIRVAQHRTVLDDVMPEYQFSERHSARVHARPEQAMQAVRQSTFGDLQSLITLLRIRGAALRRPFRDAGDFAQGRLVLEAFSASGYLSGGSEHEIVMAGWRRPWPLRVCDLAPREACRDRSLAPTAAVDGLESRRATGRRDGAAHRRHGQNKILSLRDIADPTEQGSAPAGQERIYPHTSQKARCMRHPG